MLDNECLDKASANDKLTVDALIADSLERIIVFNLDKWKLVLSHSKFIKNGSSEPHLKHTVALVNGAHCERNSGSQYKRLRDMFSMNEKEDR